MKHAKWSSSLATEIGKLAQDHPAAISALYVDAFYDGMKIGARDGLFLGVVVAVFAGMGLCAGGISYLEHMENQ